MFKARRAEDRDWARLYHWRNDALTRAAFKEQALVPLGTHLAWLRETLQDDARRIFIAHNTQSGDTFGSFRIDLIDVAPGHLECSIVVDPRQRGKGYAEILIGLMLDELSGDVGKHGWAKYPLRADVRSDNYASLRAFAQFKFGVLMHVGEFVTLERVQS